MSDIIKGAILVLFGALMLIIARMKDKLNKKDEQLEQAESENAGLEKLIEILQYSDRAKEETAEKIKDLGTQGAKYEEMVEEGDISFSDLINDWNNGV